MVVLSPSLSNGPRYVCSELPMVVGRGGSDDDDFASDCLKIIGSF